MTFIKPYIIRLAHCDPTGQVFFPNYFIIFNALTEDWFYEGLELPYHDLLLNHGISLATVKLETTFLVPTRMGETVNFWLTVSHIGRTSIRLTTGVTKDGVDRVRMNRIFVCVGQQDSKPMPIPSGLLDRINAFMMG